MECKLRKMSVAEYQEWIKDKRKKDASLPNFFGNGEQRTLNVLKGNATKKSENKWSSFKARHGANYCKNPSYREAIALRNWGIAVKIPKEEN
jgi:predicted HD phosphohydrolase